MKLPRASAILMRQDNSTVKIPFNQQTLRSNCPHPAGASLRFDPNEIDRSIPDCIEGHVRQHPDQIAFKTRNEALTWDELNRRANQVAREVFGSEDSRNKPIALLLEHGSVLVASLGVLKAAGVYVPLVPSHPLARNHYILDHTDARIIVTDRSHESLARELAKKNCRILNIDELDSNVFAGDLGLAISRDSIAFITYTSGSTGEPKGVINTHAKVLHAVAHERLFELGPGDRFTNVGSTERAALAPLLSGAGCYPWYVTEDGLEHLADWLIREEITVCRFGPRVFRQFVDSLAGREQFPKLRIIVLMGAPAHKAEVELFKAHFSSDCILVNTLGTHEVGPFRTYWIDKDTAIESEVVPVGYEIPGREVLLLDNDCRPVQTGEPGEIAVRSRYLSPGYWRMAELTKERFLPDREGGDGRIYLTGDLGRMLADGCLEYLGRKDFQVKIRGFRVDLSEVEKAILQHPGVREVIVTTRQDRYQDLQLIAYTVPRGDAAPSVSSLRRFLQDKLPENMIPSWFVVIDQIPLTATGTAKIDRRRLPDPGNGRPDLDNPYVPPQTALEKELAEIWADALSLDRVGTDDNFLDLGGHSLSAARIVLRVLKQFQADVPLPSLFQSPTISAMAHVISEYETRKLSSSELERVVAELESLPEEQAKEFLVDTTGASNTNKTDV